MEPAKRRKLDVDPKVDDGDKAGGGDAAESAPKPSDKQESADKSEAEKVPLVTEATEKSPPINEEKDGTSRLFVWFCLAWYIVLEQTVVSSYSRLEPGQGARAVLLLLRVYNPCSSLLRYSKKTTFIRG